MIKPSSLLRMQASTFFFLIEAAINKSSKNKTRARAFLYAKQDFPHLTISVVR